MDNKIIEIKFLTMWKEIVLNACVVCGNFVH